MMQKIRSLFVAAIALAASFITGSAWAVDPTVMWDCDFGTTSKIGTDGNTYTFNVNGNTIENGRLKITGDMGGLVELPAAAYDASYTVLIKYSNLEQKNVKTALMSMKTSNSSVLNMGLYAAANSLTLSSYWDSNTTDYSFGTAMTIPTGSGYAQFAFKSKSPFHGWVDSVLASTSIPGYNAGNLSFTANCQGIGIGGPMRVTTNSPKAWTGLVVESVAIFKGSYSAISGTKGTVFACADAAYTATLTEEGPTAIDALAWKDAEGNAVDYATVSSAKIAIFGNGKVSVTTSPTGTVYLDSGIELIYTTAASANHAGSGTVVYDGILPGNEKTNYTKAAWAGTVWLKNKTGLTNIDFTDYSNAGSIVRCSGIKGYLESGAHTVAGIFELVNDTFTYGFNLNNGASKLNNVWTFNHLTGSGNFIADGGSTAGVLVKDWTDFTGNISLNNKTLVFGNTAKADENKFYLETGYTFILAPGQTITSNGNGIVIDGTIGGNGTLASATTFGENSSVVASLDGVLTITGAITGTVRIDGSAIDDAETKPDCLKVLTATAETKPTCELFGVEGYELFWKGDDLYAGDSAKRALYKQFSYAGAIYTWRGANEIANAASLYYVFDPDFGIDQGTVEGVDYFKGNGTKYANVPGGKATEHNFWTTFAYSNSTGNNGEGYEAPGCVLRFVESSTYNKTIGGGFGPLSLGGLLVEKGATGYKFEHTSGGRSNLLGDPTGTAQTYWAIYENFAYNRNGAIYLSGALVFDVADGKVFDLNSGRDANSQSPILVQKIGIGSNGNFGQSVAGGTLVMKGGGKLKVAKLTALGSTLDYSNLELNRATPFIEGNLTVDKDTTFMFPKGFEPTSEDPDSSFKLCDGTLTGAVNGKRMVSFGDTVKLVDMTFSTDGTVTYVDVNEKSWTGDGADTNWSTSANWDPADKPTANADVKIAAENDDVAINLDENTAELSSLSFLGSYDVAFSGTGEITATTIDFVYMTGKIILGADGLTLNGTASGAMIVDPSVVPAGTTFLKGTAIATANVSFVNVPDGVAVVKTDAGYEMKSATEFLRYGYAFEDNVTAEPGAAATLSIGGNHAYTDGVRTRALQFTSGQNHGTDFGFGGGDFTIFAVIKAPTETGKCIFALGGQQGTDGLLGLRTAGANSVAVFTKGSTDLMTVSVEDSATMYHYYALKYDSTAHTIALSVDGGEFGEPVEYTCSTAGQFQFGGIYAGGTSGKTANATDGAIDEFQLYTAKLTAEQIQSLGAAFEPNTWKGENGGAWATASNWSYNEVPADGASVIIPTGDTAEEYKIVLASDATISLGSVKVTGAATSFEFKNGEVTMGALKSDVDIQIGENDMLCFSTANAITLAANKFIKGNGTIVYVNVLPGNEKTSYQASATWTGTVWLKDYTTSVGWVYGNQYGNGNSKIKLTNFVGYFYPYEAQTITAELVLVDEDNHVAYTLRNGNSNDNVFINKLSGSGSIVGWSGDATQRLLVKDWTYYTGNLNMFGGRGVKFGADGQAAKDHIEVGAGATYILSGQRWVANGIDVNGTIGGTGTLNGAIAFGNGSVLDSTSTQGMLTVDSFGMSIGAPTVKVVADATEEPKVMNGAFADVDTPVVYNATLVKGEETLGGVYMLVTRKDGVYAVKQSQPVNLQLVVNAGETKTFTAGETVQYVNYPSLNADGTIAVDVANLEAGAYDLAVWKYLPAATFAGYGRPLVNITNIPEGWDAELMFQVDKISLLLRDPDWISRTPITIMPLGDSITESVANFYSNYRVLLYQKLALAGYNVKSAGYWRGALNGSREPTGVNTTHTEWELQAGKASERAGKLNTSANIEDGWSNMLDLAGDPDVILLHIGINDIDDPYMTTYGYITDLTKKIMQARPNSVLILSAPMGAEYGQTYQKADTVGDRAHNNYDETWVMPLHDKLVEFFNDAKDGNVEGVDKDRIFFADLTTNVRGRWYADEVNVPYYCLDDHLHPGWIGDNLMANTWFEQVRAAFPDPTAKFHEGRTDAEKGVYTDKDLGAENNVPDAYKAGFVKARQLKDSLTGTEHFTPGDPFTYDDTNENLADNVKVKKVGYYVEYVRETPTKNIHRFVWVDMDAPDNQTLANVGFPYAAKNQSVVSKLHVYGNHPGVYNVDSNDDTVTGFVEFTPYGYSSGASSVSGAPANWYEFDWNDTLNSSGSGYGCMQVHRILNPAEFSRQGQVVFAYNGWSYSDNKTELGIGNFGQFFTTKSVDWTWLHNTELGAASNYKIQNIEIWIKPTDLVTDDDGKVYETIEDAINNGERQEGATLTANKDTDINLGELTSDKPFKLDAKAIAMDKIGWTDIEPTEAEGSGKYLACGSDGKLTVKTGKPTTDKFTSFECYVLGIDASKEGGDKPVLNAPPDDGKENKLTAFIDTARTIKGVNIKLIAVPDDGSGSIDATGKSISLGLPDSGERIYTIKVEVEEATNP